MASSALSWKMFAPKSSMKAGVPTFADSVCSSLAMVSSGLHVTVMFHVSVSCQIFAMETSCSVVKQIGPPSVDALLFHKEMRFCGSCASHLQAWRMVCSTNLQKYLARPLLFWTVLQAVLQGCPFSMSHFSRVSALDPKAFAHPVFGCVVPVSFVAAHSIFQFISNQFTP